MTDHTESTRHLSVRYQGRWTRLIHPGAAICFGLSPSGQHFLVNSAHGQLVLRRSSDMGQVALLNGHRMTVADVTFISEEVAASCGADGTTRVWSIPDRSMKAVLNHDGPAVAVASVAGQIGVTVLESGDIVAWDSITCEPVWTERVSATPVINASSSRNSPLIFLSSADSTIVEVDSKSKTFRQVRSIPDGQGTDCIAANASGTRITTCVEHADRRFVQYIIDAVRGDVLFSADLGTDQAHSAEWIRDDAIVLGLDSGAMVKIGLVEGTWCEQARSRPHRDIVWTLEGIPGSGEVLSGSSDGTVKRISVAELLPVDSLHGLTRGVWATAWHPDGRRLLTCAADGTASIWDPDTGERFATRQIAGGWIRLCAWMSPDTAVLVAQEGAVYVIDTSLNVLKTIGLGLDGKIWSADLRNSVLLLVGSDVGEVATVNVDSETVTTVKIPNSFVTAVHWKSDGSGIVGTRDGKCFLLDVLGDRPLLTLNSQISRSDEITAVEDLDDVLLIGYSSGVLLTAGPVGSATSEHSAHAGPIQSIVVSGVGTFVTCGADGEIVRYGLGSALQLVEVGRHTVASSSAGLSLSGTRAAVGSAGIWVLDQEASTTTPGHERVALGDPPIGLVDRPVTYDSVGRSGLADELALLFIRTSREYELDRDEGLEEAGFLVHIGGVWGSGKTSMARMLERRLSSRRFGSSWQSARFNAWEDQDRPPIDGMLRAIDETVSASAGPARRWVLAARRYQVERPGILGLLAVATAVALAAGLLVQGIVTWAAIFTSETASTVGATEVDETVGSSPLFDISTASDLLAIVTAMAAGTAVVLRGIQTRYLARRDSVGRERYERWVLQRLREDLMLTIDELDRCPDRRVMEVLSAVNRLIISNAHIDELRENSNSGTIGFVLLSDRDWIYNAIEASHQTQTAGWEIRSKRLGEMFMEKLALLSVDLPPLSRSARQGLVATSAGEADISLSQIDDEQLAPTIAASSSIRPGPNLRRQPTRQRTPGDPSAAKESTTTATSVQLTPVLSSVGDWKNRDLVDRGAEIERRARVERHYIAEYSHLLGSTPRQIKRTLVRYWIERVIAATMGRNPDQFESQILLESILIVRWPNVVYNTGAAPDAMMSRAVDLGIDNDSELMTVLDRLRTADRVVDLTKLSELVND